MAGTLHSLLTSTTPHHFGTKKRGLPTLAAPLIQPFFLQLQCDVPINYEAHQCRCMFLVALKTKDVPDEATALNIGQIEILPLSFKQLHKGRSSFVPSPEVFSTGLDLHRVWRPQTFLSEKIGTQC